MFYEQEAVHAKPDHKQDGRVKIDMQYVAVDNASSGTGLWLVICIQVGEAWQCAEENEVRDRQAEEVNIAALPLWQTKYVTKYNQKVAKETNAELDAIKGWQVVPLQHIINLCAVEHHAVVVAVVAGNVSRECDYEQVQPLSVYWQSSI